MRTLLTNRNYHDGGSAAAGRRGGTADSTSEKGVPHADKTLATVREHTTSTRSRPLFPPHAHPPGLPQKNKNLEIVGWKFVNPSRPVPPPPPPYYGTYTAERLRIKIKNISLVLKKRQAILKIELSLIQ